MPAMMQLKELLCSPSYLIAALSGSFLMMGYFAPFGFLVGKVLAMHGYKRRYDYEMKHQSLTNKEFSYWRVFY